MEISAIKGGGIRRLMANAIKKKMTLDEHLSAPL